MNIFSAKRIKKGGGRPPENKNVSVIEISGKKFATGLLWKQIENPRAVMKEARRYGKENDMDIVATRYSPDQIQAGYVKKSHGVTKDMFSLATTMAGIIDTYPDLFLKDGGTVHDKDYEEGAGWLCIVEVPKNIVKRKTMRNKNRTDVDFLEEDGDESLYYLLATFNGIILPQTDKIGSFSNISNAAQKIISLFHGEQGGKKSFKWIYAPEKFNISEDSLELKDIVTSDKVIKEYRLKPLTFGLTKKELVYIALFIIICSGYVTWQGYEKKKEADMEAEMARIQQQLAAEQAERIRKQTGVSIDKRDLVKPWVTKPGLATFLSICDKKMMKVPSNIGGWNLKGAECEEHNITAFYSRMPYTTVNDFRDEVKRLLEVEPFIDSDGNSGGYTLKNEMPPSGGEDVIEALPVMSELTSLFQRLGINYKISEEEKKVLPPLPGQEKNTEPKAAPWAVLDFEINTPARPVDVFAGFTIPVIRIDNITIDTTKVTETMWTVKGKVYVKSE